jgi:hypothetical protein
MPANSGNRHAARSLHSRLHQNEVIDPYRTLTFRRSVHYVRNRRVSFRLTNGKFDEDEH